MPARSLIHNIKFEPDLTPLLDVVFQLMTFFIMVSNFSKDIFDQRVHLPVAGSARPISDPDADRLVLNIDAEGRLLISNRLLSTEEAIREIDFQAELARLNAQVAGLEITPGENLPTTIIFRADKDTEFADVFKLITACQAHGFVKFDLRALSAPSFEP